MIICNKAKCTITFEGDGEWKVIVNGEKIIVEKIKEANHGHNASSI